jgi:hypothetical protein
MLAIFLILLVWFACVWCGCIAVNIKMLDLNATATGKNHAMM